MKQKQNMKTGIKSTFGFTLIELLVVITIIGILAALALPVYNGVRERGDIITATNNSKQTALALKLYATDNRGAYPNDPAFVSSNDVFRELIESQVVTSEEIFAAPNARNGRPDGDISDGNALLAGENHWEMTRGLTDSSPANIPLIWEDSVTGTWNPTWNPNGDAETVGRTFSGGRILVVLNDTSATMRKLEDRDAVSALEQVGTTNIFEAARRGTEDREVYDNLNRAN